MKKIAIFVFVFLILGAGVILLVLFSNSGEGTAVLKVNSTPTANIFLDNQNIGKTPYEDRVAPGEYTLKLIPESTTTSSISWEGKIKLSTNLLTFINRDLTESELTSAGEMLILEKMSTDTPQIVVVSSPDRAQVLLAGEEKGLTPLVIPDVEAGSYELMVMADGYQSRTVKIKTTQGYKLNTSFQLAKSDVLSEETSKIEPDKEDEDDSDEKEDDEEETEELPELDTPSLPYIEILDTPTGFLRVRGEPSTATGKEIGRVEPEERFSLLDEEIVAGVPWYKIEYEEEEEGWVSGRYADKFE